MDNKPEKRDEEQTPAGTAAAEATLPRAKQARHAWRFPYVWVVPVVSLIVAGYLVYQRVHEFGPELTIHFSDASGLKPDQTPIRYRGVNIGKVTKIEISHDGQSAVVKGRLRREAVGLARDKSLFWIVRPELGLGNVSGLGTIISGPHIEIVPAGQKPAREFKGLNDPPATVENEGLNLVLLATHRGSLKRGAPVYYKGIEVGAIRDCRLSDDAASVTVNVFVQRRYAILVHGDSKFWNVSGVDMKFGLFRGAEINVESLQSLVTGGIAFGTPNDTKEGPVKDGAVFRLYEEAKPEWLEWSPKIQLEK